MSLPTKAEYENAIYSPRYEFREWSEPKYECELCGGGMCRNEMLVCASIPPKYKYKCNKCGHVDYQCQ